MDFRLPDLGEGIDSATVTAVMVKPGDAVAAGQNVISVETDKASLEIPSDVAGVVQHVRVKPGDKIPAGGVVLTLGETSASPVKDEGAKPASSEPAKPAAPPLSPSPPSEPAIALAPAPVPAPASRAEAPASQIAEQPPRTEIASSPTNGKPVPAGPATRKMARELGVALAEVPPSGRGGRVTIDDIKLFVRQRIKGGGGSADSVPAQAGYTMPDFSKFGPIEKKPVSQLRQTIARNLTLGWRTMPMVTQHDQADITELEAGRKRSVETAPPGSPKVTMTILAIKAVVAALREFPRFATSYDMAAGELIFKKFFHIGIAVDTDRGLVVPVIRDADKKSIRDLAAEVTTLAEKARAGKLAIDEMRGGIFTITNLGGIGGTSFTPIVNFPEVAILGMSRSTLQPVVRDGQIVPRLLLPLSLTYDHRVIDGADGARFTARLVQLFSNPLLLLMET